jgi:hypothetical protein
MINTSKLLEVKLKYPELMSEQASEIIFNLHKELKDKEDLLSKTRMSIYDLEKEVKILKNKLQDLQHITSLSYEERDVKTIKNKCNILIDNPTDAARSYYKPN